MGLIFGFQPTIERIIAADSSSYRSGSPMWKIKQLADDGAGFDRVPETKRYGAAFNKIFPNLDKIRNILYFNGQIKNSLDRIELGEIRSVLGVGFQTKLDKFYQRMESEARNFQKSQDALGGNSIGSLWQSLTEDYEKTHGAKWKVVVDFAMQLADANLISDRTAAVTESAHLLEA